MPESYHLAECDEDFGYRYSLKAAWNTPTQSNLIVIQLNPSTADSKSSDPTIGKVSNWAVENGFSHITFLNLFAIRTPKPTKLKGKSYAELVGIKNDDVCAHTIKDKAAVVIFAWGGIDFGIITKKDYQRRLAFLKGLLGNRAIFSVGKMTQAGFPRHGRMWNKGYRDMSEFDLTSHIENIAPSR